MKDIQGLVVPMVSPVEPDRPNEIDYGEGARLAMWLVDRGAAGLFIGGTTGRFSDFTPEQSSELCRVVHEAVGSRCTVFAGACDSGPARWRHAAELMARSGADYIVALGPFFLPRSAAEIEALLADFIERAPLPVLLYNNPDLTGYTLRPEWVVAAAVHSNLVGYKDSTNDLEHFRYVRARTRGRLKIFIGKERILTQALLEGADGVVVSFANGNPALFARSITAAVDNDREALAAVQREIDDTVDRFESSPRRSGSFFDLLRFLQTEAASQDGHFRFCAERPSARGEDT